MENKPFELKRPIYRTLVMIEAFKQIGFKIRDKDVDVTCLMFSNADAGIEDVMFESGDAEMMFSEVELILYRMMLPYTFFDGLYDTCEARQNDD